MLTVFIPDPYRFHGVMPNMVPGMAVGTGSSLGGGPQSTNAGLKKVERIRTEFPETWLWINKTTG